MEFAKLLIAFYAVASLPLMLGSLEPVLSFGFSSFSSESSSLQLFGDARAYGGGLHLTRYSLSNVSLYSFSVGRAFYKQGVNLLSGGQPLSFTTNFSFSINVIDSTKAGHGMAFVIASQEFVEQPSSYIGTCWGGWMGLVNLTTNGAPGAEFVAVEFDTYLNSQPADGPGFNDPDDNHVGINSMSMASLVQTQPSELNTTYGIDLKGGGLVTAWIEYDGPSRNLKVFVSTRSDRKPARPLLQYTIDLYKLNSNNTYLGFASATGRNYEIHTLYAWYLQGTPGSLESISQKSPRSGPSVDVKTIAVIVTSTCAAFLLLCLVVIFVRSRLDSTRKREGKSFDWSLRKFSYEELSDATDSFNEKNVLGKGGCGTVYKGVLTSTGSVLQVAIKLFSQQAQHEREFQAEITTIGRLSHRNLVQLYGWCHENPKQLLLVYEYMHKGSLDKWLRDSRSSLTWKVRYKIVCGLAAGLHYLHEEWEQRIVHRDIKPSNIMLDADFNAKIGDFGLARTAEHSWTSDPTTAMAGTFGYIAPELARTGKPTTFSNVYSFGAVVLEVGSGRRVLDWRLQEEEEYSLVEYAHKLKRQSKLMELADAKLELYQASEMELLLEIGVACTDPQPELRPTMRHVLQTLRRDVPCIHL